MIIFRDDSTFIFIINNIYMESVVIHVHTCTAPATGNVKMKRVCFRSKHVCFSSANVGVVFSLCLETRRKSPLVPCSVYSWIIHGILKAFPFVIFHTLRLRRKRYSSVRRPGTAY